MNDWIPLIYFLIRHFSYMYPLFRSFVMSPFVVYFASINRELNHIVKQESNITNSAMRNLRSCFLIYYILNLTGATMTNQHLLPRSLILDPIRSSNHKHLCTLPKDRSFQSNKEYATLSCIAVASVQLLEHRTALHCNSYIASHELCRNKAYLDNGRLACFCRAASVDSESLEHSTHRTIANSASNTPQVILGGGIASHLSFVATAVNERSVSCKHQLTSSSRSCRHPTPQADTSQFDHCKQPFSAPSHTATIPSSVTLPNP